MTPTPSAAAARSRPREIAEALSASAASEMPVPRPVTSPTERPVMAAMSAADGVVLPMPISPVTRQSAPSATSCSAIKAPTSSAASASAVLMAGSVVRLPVPERTLAERKPATATAGAAPAAAAAEPPTPPAAASRPGIGVATPTSTTMTRAPTSRAMTLMAAPPARKFATICAVTACGHGVTPSLSTPWSPAKTATTGRTGTGGGQAPAMADKISPRDSRRPRDPAGLVRRP